MALTTSKANKVLSLESSTLSSLKWSVLWTYLQCSPISYKLQVVWVNLIYKWFQYQELEVLTPKEREGTQNPHLQQAPMEKCRKLKFWHTEIINCNMKKKQELYKLKWRDNSPTLPRLCLSLWILMKICYRSVVPSKIFCPGRERPVLILLPLYNLCTRVIEDDDDDAWGKPN